MLPIFRAVMASSSLARKSEGGSTQNVRGDIMDDLVIAQSFAAAALAEANDLQRALDLSKVDNYRSACVPCAPTSLAIACANDCGREHRKGYSTCCRTCEESGGKRHGASCEYETRLAEAILESAKEASAKETILLDSKDQASCSICNGARKIKRFGMLSKSCDACKITKLAPVKIEGETGRKTFSVHSFMKTTAASFSEQCARKVSSQSTAASDDSKDGSWTSQDDDDQWESFSMCEDDEVPKRRHQLWQRHLTSTLVGDVEQLQAGVPEDVARQIDLDVPRTHNSGLYDTERTSLRRVLRAYAAQNPTTGYCQGMNSLAAIFITSGFDEATSLQGLCSLIARCCPEYFGPSLEGYIRDVAVLDVLAHKILSPAVYRKLKSLDIPLSLLAADHFLTLGSHTWPRQSIVQFWDLLFAKGSPALFASFLVLLELYLPDDVDGPEQVEIFRRTAVDGFSKELDLILERTRALLPTIPQDKLECLRNAYAEHGADGLSMWF